MTSENNKILLLVEKNSDMLPIARAFRGIKNTTIPIDLNTTKNLYHTQTGRFWVYVNYYIPGLKYNQGTEITLAVAAESYEMTKHGWDQLVEMIEEY